MTENEYNMCVNSFKTKISNGDVEAMKLLGDLYFQGISGKEENVKEAFPYWKMAADNGDMQVMGKVGVLLIKGVTGVKDSAGINYLIKAANGGDTYCQNMLGSMYETGTNVSKNANEAIKYYRMSAQKNNAIGQYNLGRLLFFGKKSNSEWMDWLCCSYVNGNKDAQDFLNEMAKEAPELKEGILYTIDKVKKNGMPSTTEQHNREGCYIATAVYGSYDAMEVIVLRRFRDEVLSKSFIGKSFIKIYYLLSPAVAKKLKNLRKLNLIVKKYLDVFVEWLNRNIFN